MATGSAAPARAAAAAAVQRLGAATWLRACTAGVIVSALGAAALSRTGRSASCSAIASVAKLATTTSSGPPTTSHRAGTRHGDGRSAGSVTAKPPGLSARHDEGRLLGHRDACVIDVLDLELDRVRAGPGAARRLVRHAC